MKKLTVLFASLLCVAYIAVAQLKLYVYQNDGTRTEFVASTVDSIALSTTEKPNQPDDPVKPEESIERKLYFVNKAGWTGVKAYIWSSEDGKYNFAWPGESAYKEDYRINGYEVYSYDMSDKQLYDMIIFNGLATSTSTVLSQTSDLEIDYSKPYYYDGIWFSSLGNNGYQYVDLGAVAQEKLYVYQNDGTRTEFVVSTVDSIAFSTITDSPDQPDDPIKPVDPTNGHEYVDLGLPSGTKWATMNVGADSPEDDGDYFAWGETSPKSTYNWSTYKWYKDINSDMTKYCTDSDYGTVDNKTTLDLLDDAAYVNWGSSWRMPTKAEQDELRNTNYTTWAWTTQNGVKGYKVTSKINGNSIFLPAAGYRYDSDLDGAGSDGYYWSSSLYTLSSVRAFYLGFDSDKVYSYGNGRRDGQSVRPVMAK